ncbi:MAG: hypothetical protein KDA91_16635 [Planctomycetaceae bacterium]|nr:hypothetical protein [Planctomycetaceae bacterium]
MNNLTSRQRKLLYAALILVLLLPIVILGSPASKDVSADDQTAAEGSGVLAKLRVENDLGETTLGDIDPSSAAMNLVLLGLRGPAAGLLHLQAMDYQERKDWAKLRATVDSIIRLQPHYVQIWKFQGWNLAFNVSREWDRVDDRYYWVKEGIKFLQKGTRRNQTVAILFHDVGDFISRKMSISDEKKFFRQYFLSDPDTDRFDGEADPEINERGVDSFLVSYDWFTAANEKDDLYGMTGMTHVFFRQGPAKAKLNYAEARQKDGLFDQENRSAWEDGYREWMEDYGTYTFLGLNDWKYKLNSTPQDLAELAQENGITLEEQRNLWARNLDMVHFRFWRDYANTERDEETMDAHKTLFEAKKAYAEGRGYDSTNADGSNEISEAQKLLEDAMSKWVRVFQKYPNMLIDNESYIEEAMLAVYYWRAVHDTNGKTPPDDYPLREIWDANPDRKSEVQREFLMDTMRSK